MDFMKYVGRRMAPVRLTITCLRHELQGSKGAKEVTVPRHLMDSMISTMEIFIEDCERAMNKVGTEGPDKKFVETAKQTVKV